MDDPGQDREDRTARHQEAVDRGPWAEQIFAKILTKMLAFVNICAEIFGIQIFSQKIRNFCKHLRKNENFRESECREFL